MDTKTPRITTCAGGIGNSSHSGENFSKDSLALITKAWEGLSTSSLLKIAATALLLCHI